MSHMFSRARPAAGVSIAAVATAVALGGCAINCSPIHSDLPYDQLADRVADRFPPGMPIADVRAKLSDVGLDHRHAAIPSRWWLGYGKADEGIVAEVHPGGLSGFGDLMFGGGRLYFWFGDQEELAMVGYRPTLNVLPVAYRVIPLSPEP